MLFFTRTQHIHSNYLLPFLLFVFSFNFAQASDEIYEIDSSTGEIILKNTRKSDQSAVLLSGLSTPYGLKFSNVTDQMYWISSELSNVGVASLDGSASSRLPSAFVSPYVITLDTQTFMVSKNQIIRLDYNSDGEIVDAQVLVSQEATAPIIGLAVDLENQRILWGDGTGYLTQEADLNGLNIHTLLDQPN